MNGRPKHCHRQAREVPKSQSGGAKPATNDFGHSMVLNRVIKASVFALCLASYGDCMNHAERIPSCLSVRGLPRVASYFHLIMIAAMVGMQLTARLVSEYVDLKSVCMEAKLGCSGFKRFVVRKVANKQRSHDKSNKFRSYCN